jgi:hypothetical protein
MEKIKSITEAFSMQPNYFQTTSLERYINSNEATRGTLCKEIVSENRQVDSDKQCSFYVGYNFDGEKIFEYLQSSVNVHFEPKSNG